MSDKSEIDKSRARNEAKEKKTSEEAIRGTKGGSYSSSGYRQVARDVPRNQRVGTKPSETVRAKARKLKKATRREPVRVGAPADWWTGGQITVGIH